MKLLGRILSTLLSLGLLCILILAINYRTVPTGDTAQAHFDTLIILGTTANADGTPSPEQRERVLEGVREYRAGVAPRLIMTGGPAHNAFTEAQVMKQYAIAQGVPEADVFEEDQARNTIQNIFYSAEMMHQHHWVSAQIISSPSHLPRTAMILQTFDEAQPSLSIAWHTRAANWPPEYSLLHRVALFGGEAAYCLRLRLSGFPPSKFLPAA